MDSIARDSGQACARSRVLGLIPLVRFVKRAALTTIEVTIVVVAVTHRSGHRWRRYIAAKVAGRRVLSSQLEFVGNERAIQLLTGESAKNRPFHAYLLTGPTHVGKGRAATELGIVLNCTGTMTPCRKCQSCRLILAGTHPDFKTLNLRNQVDWMDGDGVGRRTGARKLLSIEAVRGLLRDSYRRPLLGKWQVFLIEDADRLQIDAANRLLKELEEAPSRTVFILSANGAGQMIDTVVSRCRMISFSPVAVEEIRGYLIERMGSDEDNAARISRLARGRPGWAIAAFQEPSMVDLAERHSLEPIKLFSLPAADRLRSSTEFTTYWTRDQSAGRERIHTWAASVWDSLADPSGSPHTQSGVAVVSERDLLIAARLIRRTVEYLQANVLPRLAFDSLHLEYPSPDVVR